MPSVTGTSRLASLSTEDLNVSLTPATVRNAVGDSGATLLDFTILAGQKYVEITNVSPLGGGDPSAVPTVNGKPLLAGVPIEFDADLDPETNEYVRSREYVVITNGAYIAFEYYK